MASISVYRRPESGCGRLRFRISDGRRICLYWSTGLSVNNFPNSAAKASALEQQYLDLLREVYSRMLSEGLKLSSAVLREQMQRAISRQASSVSSDPGSTTNEHLKPTISALSGNSTSLVAAAPRTCIGQNSPSWQTPPIVRRYLDYLEQNFEAGFMGQTRFRQCCGKARRIERWLRIIGRTDMRAQDFSADELLHYRNFVMQEYLFAARFPQFYPQGCRLNRPMKNNSVVHEMRALRCFFAELEDKEEIRRSPFRSLSKEKRRSIMHEMYNRPIFLRSSEFQALRRCPVPQSLLWVKQLFLFNCQTGCRIGDLCRLGPGQVSVSDDGIEFVHYLPSKTRTMQTDNREVETPLLPEASAILHKGLDIGAKFSLRKYNKLLPKLLRLAGIGREVSVWQQETGRNEYRPLWQMASSKLARKTFVDMMNKVQINAYAAGLHKDGSRAVFHYTHLELADRYALMKLAFADG
ncbi:MAG: hypothetical protein ACI3ZK_02090 [Candidatus Cryptobacteroides sp.]